jgi:hypothetical protein
MKKEPLSLYVKIAIACAVLLGICYLLNFLTIFSIYDIVGDAANATEELANTERKVAVLRACTYVFTAILLGSLSIEFFKKRKR